MNDVLQYKDYYATVHFSNEDDVFYGKVIGVNDLITFEGASVKALKDAFKEAINDYVETCKELDKTPDKTYKGNFNVRIPSELHKQAAVFAAIRNMSLNEFVRYAIGYTITHTKEQKGEDSRVEYR